MNILQKTQDIGLHALANALASVIGKDKEYRRDQAARLLDCSDNTLLNLMRAETECGHTQLARMFVLFGPRFINLYLERFGFTGVRPMTRTEQNERALHTSVSKLDATLTAALEDGHIDHVERKGIEPLFREVCQEGEQFLQKEGA